MTTATLVRTRVTTACAARPAERRSGLMVMLNGDTYVPFLMKMLANPTGPPAAPKDLWAEFAKRFFAAAA